MIEAALRGSIAVVAGIGLGLNDAVILAVAVIVGIFTLVRGRSDVWKSNYEAERARNDLLTESVHKLELEVEQLKQQIEVLRAQPDVSSLHEAVSRVIAFLEKHEDREIEVWQNVEATLKGNTAAVEFLSRQLPVPPSKG